MFQVAIFPERKCIHGLKWAIFLFNTWLFYHLMDRPQEFAQWKKIPF